ncbi:hypothetical protein AAG570_002929 [Ranatra chinensis]|uniref:Uncharacterized protein n=1 Tax=Ranatra chinensis TaxID=642074 RepID=A0ABD0Y7H0_9HEMI
MDLRSVRFERRRSDHEEGDARGCRFHLRDARKIDAAPGRRTLGQGARRKNISPDRHEQRRRCDNRRTGRMVFPGRTDTPVAGDAGHRLVISPRSRLQRSSPWDSTSVR